MAQRWSGVALILLAGIGACKNSSVGTSENPGGLFLDIQPNGPRVVVWVKGQTFIGGSNAFLSGSKQKCSQVPVSWFQDDIGLYHPYPQADTSHTNDGGLHTYTEKRCGTAIPTGGYGPPINGGQVQVSQSLNGPEYQAFSVPADLSKEGIFLDHPVGGTIELFGQPANATCVFDQWRINNVAHYENPIVRNPQANEDIVGWFICTPPSSSPPPPAPPPPPPPPTCIDCPPVEGGLKD